MKDAFALVGMSAYLNLIVDLPAKPTAICLIAFFTILNIIGSKTSASLQMGMVAFLLIIMGWYMVAGLPDTNSGLGDFDPFTSGSGGFIAAIGLVFVSYGGLTKVASIAEEVEDPSRNIPLGVILSLIVSTVIYTVGVLVAVAVVPASDLIEDEAPSIRPQSILCPQPALDLLSQLLW